jgi:uncharacterized protein YcnI
VWTVNPDNVSARDLDLLTNWVKMVKQLCADHADEKWEIDKRDLYIAAFRLLAATQVLGGKSGDLA